MLAEGTYKELQESGKDFTKLLSSRPDSEEADVSDKPLHKRQSSVQVIINHCYYYYYYYPFIISNDN